MTATTALERDLRSDEPMTDALRKALRSEAMQFKNVRAAVVWYVTQKAHRSLRSVPLERGSGRPSDEHIDRMHATYAKLAVCIERQRDDADLDDEFFLFGRRVADLATWYVCEAERGQQALADELGMSPRAMWRYCEVTESVIRRRMRARGLLEGR